MGDFECRHGAVGALGLDEEAAVATKEPGGDALRSERRVVEVAENGRLVGHVHRLVVIRPLPSLVGRFVARPAGLPADESGVCRVRCRASLGPPSWRATETGINVAITAVDTAPRTFQRESGSAVTRAPPGPPQALLRLIGFRVSTLTMLFSMRTGKMSSGRGAGGPSTAPCMSNVEAWHGQTKRSSLPTHGTVQPRWVHSRWRARKPPSSRRTR